MSHSLEVIGRSTDGWASPFYTEASGTNRYHAHIPLPQEGLISQGAGGEIRAITVPESNSKGREGSSPHLASPVPESASAQT